MTKHSGILKSIVEMGRPNGFKNVALDQKNKITAIHSAGLTPSHIASHYKMSRNTLETIMKLSKHDPTATTHTIRMRNGRKPKIIPDSYDHLIN